MCHLKLVFWLIQTLSTFQKGMSLSQKYFINFTNIPGFSYAMNKFRVTTRSRYLWSHDSFATNGYIICHAYATYAAYFPRFYLIIKSMFFWLNNEKKCITSNDVTFIFRAKLGGALHKNMCNVAKSVLVQPIQCKLKKLFNTGNEKKISWFAHLYTSSRDMSSHNHFNF